MFVPRKGKDCMQRRMRLSLMRASAALLALPAWTAATAGDQEAAGEQEGSGQEAAGPEGARVYLPAEFARFTPRTALDMVRQVPGFSIQGQDQARGLGQASGNVLINGQRISGKSNDAVTELGRIPASSVVRIEIVDGATLNIAGLSGQVANVIVRATGLAGQFQWRGEVRARNTEPLFTNGSASLTGSAGPLSYTIGLRNDSFRQGNAGPARITDAAGILIDFRRERALISGERPRISAGLNYRGDGGTVANLNLGYERFWFDLLETSDRSGSDLADRLRELRSAQNRYSYEVSGDYERGLGSGRLKLIGLHKFEHNPSDTNLVTSFADETPASGSRFVRIGDESETVGRVEYRWSDGLGDWQASAEAAFNGLDNVSSLFALAPDGEFISVPLPGGTAKVTEDRYEGALSWGRKLASDLAVQASLGGEYSRLSQTGPLGQERTFWRPKGFLTTAWQSSPRLSINMRIERRVGQLNFSDFLASQNLGRDVSDAANPDLVPPQSWDAEVEAIRNLGAWGNATLRVYGRLISDIVDQIPIDATREAAGNIDKATVLGLEWKATLQMAPLGWRGARLDTRLQLQDSSLDDPLTGEPRRISNDLVRTIDFNLRHDVPGTDWAWGGQLSQQRRAASVRLSEVSINSEISPFLAALYLEHKDVAGLTVRGSIRNLFGGDDFLDRTVFVGRRDGPIAFVESRSRSVGPIFALSVSGTL